MRKYYKLVIKKPNGAAWSFSFPMLKDCKISARRVGKPKDRVIIEEFFEDEQNTLYDYVMEDWGDKWNSETGEKIDG
jgi:hypothetical protein